MTFAELINSWDPPWPTPDLSAIPGFTIPAYTLDHAHLPLNTVDGFAAGSDADVPVTVEAEE